MKLKPILMIGTLIAATCCALAFSNTDGSGRPVIPESRSPAGPVSLSAHWVQDKIMVGGDGRVSMILDIAAEASPDVAAGPRRPVDMVIVLDRSGSMEGGKIRDARAAVVKLVESLSPEDRFALVSYSDTVFRHTPLTAVTAGSRPGLVQQVRDIHTGGGTNLGAGLQAGLGLLCEPERKETSGRLILISDGLANEGITDTAQLGRMASVAREKFFSVSTIGVGDDFNEILMTAIADRGTGQYYYLSSPEAIAGVFQAECLNARSAVATGLEITVPLRDGVRLIDAGGYPIEVRDHSASFFPGDFRSGQRRTVCLTFQVPTHAERTFDIEGLQARYLRNGEPASAGLSGRFTVACVQNRQEVMASIRKEAWEKKVVQDDYNRLKEEVAEEIRNGKPQAAMERIESYAATQDEMNAVVRSPQVENALKKDIPELKRMVEQTFSGNEREVAEKQKSSAKALQFEGYKGRKAK